MSNDMEDGKWYDLSPPSVIHGQKYHKVRCWYKVPNQGNEYVVKGTPEGSETEESFVLRFTDRGVNVTPTNSPPTLRLVK